MKNETIIEIRAEIADSAIAELAPARKIVQISESCNEREWTVTALCNDGTAWLLGKGVWKQLPPIPQGEA